MSVGGRRGTRRFLVAGTLLAVTACGAPTATSPPSTSAQPTEPATAPPSTTAPPTAPPETTPPPNLVRGGMGLVGVMSGGIQVGVITVVPEGFEIGDEAPVVLAFPPGDQALDTASAVVDGIYEERALERGWVVVSPVAPGGVSFWQGSETHLGPILDWIETWVRPEGGAVHLLGVSNGGISVFRAAALHTDRVASLVVFPGYPRGGDPLDGLVGLPVRMFVGGADTSWIAPMEETRDALLALGADVTLEVIADAPHFIPELADGTILFDVLDSLRSGS